MQQSIKADLNCIVKNCVVVMLASIAINESAKHAAFALIDQGYMQSNSVQCPLCGKKYLVLLDQTAYGRNQTIQGGCPNISRHLLLGEAARIA
jgi:hypothetical protein